MKHMMFYPALWAGKLVKWNLDRQGRTKTDRPGMVSMRLCSRFLRDASKPGLTVCVSGTNGKTTVSNLIAQVLQREGKRVSFNDWGANHHAGQARVLLDATNWRNRSVSDAAVIETDELLSPMNVPRIAPQYLVVTNIGRDSMLRNANPEYIQSRLSLAAQRSENTTLVLNADDPLSCFLGEGRRVVRFGVADLHLHPLPNISPEFTVCPKCGAQPHYRYRQYRQIGSFRCPACGLENPQADYFVTSVENGFLQMREPAGTQRYPLLSDSPYHIYNEAALIATLRDLGIPATRLAGHLENVHLPASRETAGKTVCGVALRTQMVKGQNPAAASAVFESIGRDDTPKELVLMLGLTFDSPLKSETAAWIYDTDYERLNCESVKKIIIGGERALDHRVRFLLAGVPEKKLVCELDPMKLTQYVQTDGIAQILVLHDVTFVSRAEIIRAEIERKLLEQRGESAQ